MKISDEHELNEEIEKVKKVHEQFIHQLKKLKILSKEEFLQLDYNKNLKKLAPWLSVANISDALWGPPIKSESSRESPKELIKKETVEDTMAKIKEHPDKISAILNQFLVGFPDLSEADRLSLVHNFKSLEGKSLKKELDNITLLFQ